MPSFADSAVLIVLALLLFGPKKLPVLARQLGKLMADFRRASNEFRTQMEEELRISEQADRQKKLAALESAAPATPAIAEIVPEPEQPNPVPAEPEPWTQYGPVEPTTFAAEPASTIPNGAAAPEPAAPHAIATSGDLSILPPTTGLPVPNTPQPSIAGTVPAPEPELETETLHG
ncbi:MAG: twin-arginine translocase TatA/TatE family subunit [Acidobacteriaceae bacterium]|jgi:sec-independent protein translocase protein TatB